MAAAKATGIKVVDLRLADVSQPASDLIAGQTDGESDKAMQMGVAVALTKANGSAVDSLVITSKENPPSKGMGDTVKSEMAELRRAVEQLGFVGCNLDPDPSGGHWNGPPLTDRSWVPLYEAMVELDVPATVHVSAVDNPNFHATGSHYLNADTTGFMQLWQGDLFVDFPSCGW